MEKSFILEEIEATFPFVKMPPEDELTVHPKGCRDCDDVREDIEYYRDKEITGKAIRSVSRYLSVSLTPKAMQWILPHYLRFCFTDEAEYNRMETDSLIVAFAPDLQFKKNTLKCISLLNKDQINCLIHFFEWCLKDEYWSQYCPENINNAIIFLREEVRPV